MQPTQAVGRSEWPGTGAPGPEARVVALCPNSLLALLGLTSVTYVAYLGSLSALLFLACGLWLILRRPRAALSETRRYFWVQGLVGWCLLSVLWSDYPALTLRSAVQLGLTFAIAVAMATRLSPRRLLLVVFVAISLAVVGSLLFGRVRIDGIWFGVFGSKNAFAQTMSIYILAALALLLDPAMPRLWRMAGAAGLVLGVPMLMNAQSAGALLTTVVVFVLMLGLIAVRRMPPIARLVAGTLGLLVAVLVVLLLAQFQSQLTALLLETTGKDMTLTGRTELWQVALQELARAPLTGQGYRAVWVQGNPLAEEMWARFDIAARSGFHFHNTFLSNAVEIGLIGIAIQIGLFLSAVWLTLRWSLRAPGAASLFFAAFMLRQLILCMVEVVVYAQFDLASILSIAALILGLRARDAARSSAARHRPNAEPAVMT